MKYADGKIITEVVGPSHFTARRYTHQFIIFIDATIAA